MSSTQRQLSPVLFVQLSTMMFLQFFIWGAWYVTAPNYLSTIGFTADDFGWTYSVGPIAAMISPFFVGMVADRFFSAQRVLGVLHLAGGAAMFGATMLMKKAEPSADMINIYFFGYMLTYFPTLALTNTLAMKNMEDPEKQFPVIRVAGTIGWIVAGFALTRTGLETPDRRSHSGSSASRCPTRLRPRPARFLSARSWESTRWSCWPIPPTWFSWSPRP